MSSHRTFFPQRCYVEPSFVIEDKPLNTEPLYRKVSGGWLEDPILGHPLWVNELSLHALKELHYDPLGMKIEVVEDPTNSNMITYRIVTTAEIKE